MEIVKLNAINSTNNYLKELSKDVETANWTVVTAEHQISGRGQMETKWESEKGKNLTFSILIRFEQLKSQDQFYLNCAISLGVFNALKNCGIPKLKVKWPNDIMSASKKLGGILIENILVNDRITHSVIGIGLNVNQEKFPDYLPRAVSMKQVLNHDFDCDKILHQTVYSMQQQIELLTLHNFDLLHRNYEQVLYKKDKVLMFENKNKEKFMGKIIGVTNKGKLQVVQENEVVKQYNFKEIIFLN